MSRLSVDLHLDDGDRFDAHLQRPGLLVAHIGRVTVYVDQVRTPALFLELCARFEARTREEENERLGEGGVLDAEEGRAYLDRLEANRLAEEEYED